MKFLSSLSIRKKLLILIFVAVLPALGIILFSGIERRENEIVTTKRDILHLVQSLAALQEQRATSTRQLLQTLAQLPEVQNIDAKACNKIFRNIHEQNPIYSTIAAATPDGNMFAASAPFTPGSVNLADRKHIRDVIRTRDFSAGEYIVGKVSRVPSINYTYPVLDETGKLIAVIIAGIKLDKYKEFMTQVNLPEGSVMGITDYKNLLLYRFPEHRDIPPGTPIPLKYFQGVPVNSKEVFYEGIGIDNMSRVYAYKRLWLRDKEPWYLGIYVGVDKKVVLHQANMELVYNLGFLGVACFFAMLFAWIAGNSIIVEPLNKLVIATQRFGKGELHIRTDLPPREDELGRLAKSFDTMAAMLEMNDLDRRKAEEALRESEERFNLAIAGTGAGLWDWDMLQDQVVYSAQWKRMLGYEVHEVEDTFSGWKNLWHPDDCANIEKALQDHLSGKTDHYEIIHRLRHKGGGWLWILTRGDIVKDAQEKPVRWVGTNIDITAQRQAEEENVRLEAQNRQLQKAESLGRMAGAIAHHFNNQLGAVIGNLELAMMELPQGERAHAKITAAMKASNRAAEMSGLMLTYLGQSFDKREPLDLSDACRNSLPMFKTIMPGDVVMETDLPSPGPAIRTNTNHIQQIMANLITNAWEAIGKGRGAIQLYVKTVSPAEIPVAHRFPLAWQPQDNAYALLEVTDTGAGIADNDIERIFDPFFSSKFTGRGMGLAVVLGIVKAHGGVITVESTLGRGSAFRVFFPMSREAVLGQPDKAAQLLSTEGGGMVLLVEDEEVVRDMARAMLTGLGFTVLEAKDGAEAVEVFQERQERIRFVLCDLTMPRMNGWETLTALRKLAPDIPVILASGYDKAHVMAGDHVELPQVFLGKPYKMKGLSDAISQALADRK